MSGKFLKLASKFFLWCLSQFFFLNKKITLHSNARSTIELVHVYYTQMATIPRWISSDHRSQAASGPVSTWMGDGNKFWFIYYITSIALSEFSPIRGTIDCSRINCPVVLNYAWHIDISDGNWFESYPRGETVQLIQFVYYVHLLHWVIFVLSEGQHSRPTLKLISLWGKLCLT